MIIILIKQTISRDIVIYGGGGGKGLDPKEYEKNFAPSQKGSMHCRPTLYYICKILHSIFSF